MHREMRANRKTITQNGNVSSTKSNGTLRFRPTYDGSEMRSGWKNCIFQFPWLPARKFVIFYINNVFPGHGRKLVKYYVPRECIFHRYKKEKSTDVRLKGFRNVPSGVCFFLICLLTSFLGAQSLDRCYQRKNHRWHFSSTKMFVHELINSVHQRNGK